MEQGEEPVQVSNNELLVQSSDRGNTENVVTLEDDVLGEDGTAVLEPSLHSGLQSRALQDTSSRAIQDPKCSKRKGEIARDKEQCSFQCTIHSTPVASTVVEATSILVFTGDGESNMQPHNHLDFPHMGVVDNLLRLSSTGIFPQGFYTLSPPSAMAGWMSSATYSLPQASVDGGPSGVVDMPSSRMLYVVTPNPWDAPP
ncbi:Hypothetical predicted protein [Olea europaea subsp. europaea]|uniref:Uncharacterized protein n=1 Tax=Olea europaea subsp. europaea TaxID=158383 RepID=A0A8S0RMJ7_OLEEU|nr:Hypothetical predicted protein [Olea europaea subsp. europaea]